MHLRIRKRKIKTVEKKSFRITEEESKQRLDQFLLAKMPDLSRSHIKNMIDKGQVFVNGKSVKAGFSLKTDMLVDVTLLKPVQSSINPEEIPLDVVYEDEDLIVINKKQGMVVHPSSNCFSGTLVNALLYSVKNLSGINGTLRPGIVHRLDKDTSGLMLVAKNDLAHRSLASQIQEKSCVRKYISLNNGVIQKDEGQVETYIARNSNDRKKMSVAPEGKGKLAISQFKVLERYRNFTLVEWTLKTGRTHQIRVHSKHIGHTIVGDLTYGKTNPFNLKGQLLHSYYIKFMQPRTKKVLEFQIQLPNYFEEVLEKIKPSKLNWQK